MSKCAEQDIAAPFRARISCQTCGIVDMSSWDDANMAALQNLNSRKTIRKFAKGSVLFHEGDQVSQLFRLLSGVVLQRKSDHEGNSVVTRMITPSATFGFRAFIAEQPHSVTAQCATDTVICCIPADAARLAFDSNQSLERVFAQHVAQELTFTEDIILAHMRLSAPDRLLLLLDQICRVFGETADDGSHCAPLPVLRSDLAALLGIARETFSRCMNRIRADGLLDFQGNTIVIPDLGRFQDRIAAIRQG